MSLLKNRSKHPEEVIYLRGGSKMSEKVLDFKVILEPDETGGYIAVCPSLPGCYSQGETIEEALENIKEAILLVLEDMEAHGEEIPDPSKTLMASVVVTR